MEAMSNDTEITEPTAFVRYWRKSTPGAPDAEYDKHEASISVPVAIPTEGVQSQEFVTTVDAILADLKVGVWTVLGVPFEVKDGQLAEVRPEPKPQPARQGGGGGGGGNRPQAPSGNAHPDRQCGTCGGRTFNNTKGTKKNPKGPDFKCMDRDNCGSAMWLEKDGSEGDWK